MRILTLRSLVCYGLFAIGFFVACQLWCFQKLSGDIPRDTNSVITVDHVDEDLSQGMSGEGIRRIRCGQTYSKVTEQLTERNCPFLCGSFPYLLCSAKEDGLYHFVFTINENDTESSTLNCVLYFPSWDKPGRYVLPVEKQGQAVALDDLHTLVLLAKGPTQGGNKKQ